MSSIYYPKCYNKDCKWNMGINFKKGYEYLSLFFNIIQTCSTGLSVFGKKDTKGFYGPLFLIERNLFNKCTEFMI